MKGSIVNLTIDDIKVTAPDGDSVLDAAMKAGIKIPHLCYLNMHDLEILSRPEACRICVVELVGGNEDSLVQACSTLVSEGMVIRTNNEKVRDARRKAIELLLSDHMMECRTCVKNLTCELQRYAAELDINTTYYESGKTGLGNDVSSPSVVREPGKCIACRRCEAVCANVQSVGVLSYNDEASNKTIGIDSGKSLIETQCTFCGQCVAVCPTGALSDSPARLDVWSVLSDPEKYVIVQTAPAVRAALGAVFGLPAGISATGKMVSALKRLGFDKVLDTNFGADLTVMEESAELRDRMKTGGKLPIISSCCPAWIKFCEHQYPDLLPHLSSCKSPHEMFGAVAKSYLAEKLGVNPSKMVCVSLMPCLAKKFEAHREELQNEGLPNVDIVLTTRDFCRMIKEAGISFAQLPDGEFDVLMGDSSGAADIFGNTGGVMEALLRTCYECSAGKALENLEFEPLRGFKETGLKETTIKIDGAEIKVAVAHELRNAKILLDEIRDGKSNYHAIEIMACPGGCIGGGGQPYHYSSEDVLNARREVLYNEDRSKDLRSSYKNAEVNKLYDEYLDEPNSEKAHKLLHTEYIRRGNQ